MVTSGGDRELAGPVSARRDLFRIAWGLAAATEAVRRDRGSYTSAYAALSGLETSTIRHVEAEYSYPAELSSRSVANQLRAAGLSLPSPSSFGDALYYDPS